MKSGIPVREHTTLLVIDVQDRLMPVIHEHERILTNVNKLLRAADTLGVKTIVTEQYPQGLGNTCEEIILAETTPIIEKINFSCMLSEAVDEQLKLSNTKSLIICGVEAHVCVLKTALEAIDQGYEVHVVADAVSSRTSENKLLALERMRQSGIYITSVEMILFMLMNKAGTDEFKAISKLIK